MKLFKPLVVAALLALGAYAQEDVSTTDAVETTAVDENTDPQPGDGNQPEGEGDGEEEEKEKVCDPDTPYTAEELKKRRESFEPDGKKCEETFSYQYVLEQGAYNVRGFDIYDNATEAKKVVGRLDGQTGWTGINQAGEKTMSYQVAIIIKADRVLSDIFKVIPGDKTANADQFGYWVPRRGEGKPPEKWQMNLVDVYLRDPVLNTKLEVRQALYDRGLEVDKVGEAMTQSYKQVYAQGGENGESGVQGDLLTDYNISMWQFDRTSGVLTSTIDTDESTQPKSGYWIPVPSKSLIQEDRIVMVIEGTSMKQNLPEVRAGSTVPIWFQIIDYDSAITGYKLRQREEVELVFSDNYNACNLPATCSLPDEEEDGAMALTTTMGAIGASVFALASLFSF